MNTNIAVDAGPPDYQGSKGQRVAIRHLSLQPDPQQDASARLNVMFCGGFHSNMLGTKANFLADFCKARQWSFTRFDYRGHGESDGRPQDLTLQDWLEDTLNVLDSLPGPVLLVGSSMGGWLATLAALRRPDKVKGLVLLAAAPDFLQELITPRLGPSQTWDLQQNKVVLIENDYDKPHPITQALLNSGRELSLFNSPALPDQPSLAELSCPVRLLHGTRDKDVPYELSIRLMDAITHDDARLTLLHRADHRLSDERSLRMLAAELMDLASLRK
ncbi:alpha/beta fold hydrolase [Granulosicoccus antarcticus]|uniref:Palmitoyl-protein thioesterase ABHD10, mitochondrial n=1 Tax=Granulosicoccus antarcticus IMCC3135 TaxID=1192854 RepID=A0A2Z2NUC1_9GAMM|nr:alpha/beta hydrolase [Granulosicoccus antarcticus]ASJ72360.1 Sigma factor SigB regulation protein RsbQ [Granulosicoccus antarcticus IMCC3135]